MIFVPRFRKVALCQFAYYLGIKEQPPNPVEMRTFRPGKRKNNKKNLENALMKKVRRLLPNGTPEQINKELSIQKKLAKLRYSDTKAAASSWQRA